MILLLSGLRHRGLPWLPLNIWLMKKTCMFSSSWQIWPTTARPCAKYPQLVEKCRDVEVIRAISIPIFPPFMNGRGAWWGRKARWRRFLFSPCLRMTSLIPFLIWRVTSPKVRLSCRVTFTTAVIVRRLTYCRLFRASKTRVLAKERLGEIMQQPWISSLRLMHKANKPKN